MDEISMLQGLRDRDRDTYNIFFNELYPKVKFYCYEITKDQMEAEDIAVHAIVKFWERGTEGFKSMNEVRAFIFIIAKNRSFDFIKHKNVQKAHHKQLAYLNPQVQESTAELALYKMEMVNALLQEIENLPEQRREIFKLVYLQRMPRPKVAEKLNISLTTVHGHCANAAKQLREIFSEKELILLLLIVACQN
jgi:RNA polymerase sigma-70 factor (ECF subfamily)